MAERVVVVTEASAGIGRAAAIAFGQLGDAVALVAQDEGALAEIAAEIEAVGGRAFPVVAKVGDYDQVETAARLIEERFGAIDIWINNSISAVSAPFREIAPEAYRRAIELAYLGTVNGTLAALKRMLLRDRGVVIQVGSVLAYRATPQQSANCGAEFAMRGFTESVSAELLHDGSRVRLSMVQLPAATPSAALMSMPEMAARAIVRAAARPRREIFVGWTTAASALTGRRFPRLLDIYPARPSKWGESRWNSPRSRHQRTLAALSVAGLGAMAMAVIRKR